jgi:uncharacterized protein YndB with AHSA1/START domain
MPAVATDRIEKQIFIRAPRARVWKALTDVREFQQWFEAVLDRPFVPGTRTQGHVTVEGYEHVRMDIKVERLDPEHFFSYRWHPYATEAKRDYPDEQKTLVEFTLEEVDKGTRLTVVESGFDRVAADRRAETFRMHTDGWVGQLENIQAYVTA